MDRAIVLLSGGIDSATALYITKRQAKEVYSLNFVYAQGSTKEAEAASRLAEDAHVVEHLTVTLPFFSEIQKRYHPSPSPAISSAYVPARNMIFYSVAVSFAEVLGADSIIFGSNSEDARELPDATPRFLELMNQAILNGTRSGSEGVSIKILNPLLGLGKHEILRLASEMNVPLQLTWSCYEDVTVPCGVCRGCKSRSEALNKLGVPDPLSYNPAHQQ